MGMVRESEDLQAEIQKMMTDAGILRLYSTQVNASTELSLCARPLSYDVVLGGRNIASFNCPENAVTVYHAMRADFNGEVYHGK